MKEKLIDSKVLTQVALKSCQFKQNLSPGVAVMLSSPSAVRQVDGIDDSWEAKCEPGEDQLTEEKCVSNICLNSNHIAPSFPPRMVEGIAAISALIFKPGEDFSYHTGL